MDFDTTVESIVAVVLIAKFIGFIGARMYETVLIGVGKERAEGVIVAIRGLGWLAVTLAVVGAVLFFMEIFTHPLPK
jgi:hypothetical protein